MSSRPAVFRAALCAVALFWCVSAAYADMDGTYCTGNGFIVYELRSFKTPGLSAPHVLRVVRFGHGIRQAGEVGMQDFQVHVFQCDTNRVEIAGYDKDWVKCVVDISQPNAPKIIERTDEPNHNHDGNREPPLLKDMWSRRDGTIDVLPSTDPMHTYRLVLSRTFNRLPNGTDSSTTTELQEVDTEGAITQRLVLYEDHYFESGN